MSNISICTIGFPSTGKSTLINCIGGKYLLASGLCRTTIEIKKINKVLKSDDGIDFVMSDMPGINDAIDTKKEFNELTYKEIVNHDIILWCTDINTAFLTDYEKKEVDNILYVKDIITPSSLSTSTSNSDTPNTENLILVE